MAVTTFIPSVWSETLLTQLDREYIGVANCSREFEGEIKGQGSVVNIGSIGEIEIFDYTKNVDMAAPKELSTEAMTLTIDQAKAFNFQIDDIDRIQAQPSLMQAAMKKAAGALANVADQYVYGLWTEAQDENLIAVDSVSAENIIDTVISARRQLLSNGVNSNVPTALEISPEVAAVLLGAKILSDTDNSESLENGLVGRLIGFDVYISSNISVVESRHKCLARTKRAVAFAEQVNEVEAYRPESRFADALKGLHLYGAKLVYPKEYVVLDIGFGA